MELIYKIEEAIGETYLISTGQAGFMIKSKSGKLIAIDLYLSDYVEKLEGNVGYKRLLPKLILPDELNADVLIATHPHGDHYDSDSMERLMQNKKTILYASVECKNLVEKQNIDGARVKYVEPNTNVKNGDFEIFFVPCDHGEGAPDAFGVVVKVDGKVIYEVGDSCLRKDYAKVIAEQFPNLDILIGPINGAYGNMDEVEFAEFASIIKPKNIVPCHYGMFASHGGNPGKFYQVMTKEYSSQKFTLMTQGEIIKI